MTDDLSADEFFKLLSDGTRVDILRAVAVAEHDLEGMETGAELTFSEIYDRVDVDNTSKLSYHLGELTGAYLRKGEGGYSFTHAGERIVRFILSGNYEQPSTFGPEAIGGTCVFCGAETLEASLISRFFRIDCLACERQITGQPVTPAQTTARDTDELIRSVERKSSHDHRQIRGEICPECGGRLTTTVRALPKSALPDTSSVIVTSECQECLREYNAPLAYSVLYHPASVAFHWEHGVDVTEGGVWKFNVHLFEGRWTAEQISGTPEEYQVVFRHDDDLLRLRIDSDATVTQTERVRRGRGG